MCNSDIYLFVATIEMNQEALRTHKNQAHKTNRTDRKWEGATHEPREKKMPSVKLSERVDLVCVLTSTSIFECVTTARIITFNGGLQQ